MKAEKIPLIKYPPIPSLPVLQPSRYYVVRLFSRNPSDPGPDCWRGRSFSVRPTKSANILQNTPYRLYDFDQPVDDMIIRSTLEPAHILALLNRPGQPGAIDWMAEVERRRKLWVEHREQNRKLKKAIKRADPDVLGYMELELQEQANALTRLRKYLSGIQQAVAARKLETISPLKS